MFRSEDTPVLVQLFADPDVMRFSDGLLDEAEVKVWLETAAGHHRRWNFGPMAIEEKERGTTIGYGSLCRLPDM